MPSKPETKNIQALSRKKVRDEFGRFVAEGPKVVEEFLRTSNTVPLKLFGIRHWLEQNDSLLNGVNCPVIEIDNAALKKLSCLTTPNQVVGVFAKPVFEGPPGFVGKLTLLLDGIQDPGNLGTIIRCADWFGVENVVCGPTCADAFNAKVIQSTMGSIARVRVMVEGLAEFVDANSDVPVYAAAMSGENVYKMAPVGEGFLLVGNESKGISDDLLARAQRRITIPQIGEAESLNAAVATGIVLSHLHDKE